MLYVWDQTVVAIRREQKKTVVVYMVVIAKIVCISYGWTSVLIHDEVVKAMVTRGDTVHSPDRHKMQVNTEVY